MVNMPVISPFKKRYAWVQLAGHTGEHGQARVGRVRPGEGGTRQR